MPALAVAQSMPESDLAKSVTSHVRLASVAVEAGAAFVLFPELSLTGYGRHFTIAEAVGLADSRLEPLQHLANTADLVIVAGAPVSSSRGLHIGALIFRPGESPATRFKQYLHQGEEAAFVPGEAPEPVDADGSRIGLSICADVTHPEHAAAAARHGCTVYAAGCFLTPAGYSLDADLLQGYASSHRMLVLMANFGGPIAPWSSAGRSAVWSPEGRLLAAAPESGEAVVIARLAASGWEGETHFVP